MDLQHPKTFIEKKCLLYPLSFLFYLCFIYFSIKSRVQAQPISPELTAKLLGNRVAVSPIVTVEPRRRKFHKPITLTIPVPTAAGKGMINQYNGDTPTLRLLCSITGMRAFFQSSLTSLLPLLSPFNVLPYSSCIYFHINICYHGVQPSL